MDEKFQKDILKHIEDENYENALDDINTHLSKNGNDSDAHALKSMVLLEMGNNSKEALNEANIALRIDDFHFYRFLAGSAMLELNLIEDAIKTLQKAADEYEEEPDYFIKLASAYEIKGDNNSALKAIIRAIKVDPENGDLKIMKASLLNALDREKEALSELRKLKEKEPKMPGIYFIEAESYMNLENVAEAEKSILKAIEYMKSAPVPEYLERAAEIEILLRKPDEAMEFVDKALALDKENDKLKLIKGSILIDFGRGDEAMDFAFDEYRKNRENPILSFMLIDILAETEDSKKFNEFLEEAKFPESLAILSKLYAGMELDIPDSELSPILSKLSSDVNGNIYFEELAAILYENIFEDDESDSDDGN